MRLIERQHGQSVGRVVGVVPLVAGAAGRCERPSGLEIQIQGVHLLVLVVAR